MSFTGPMRLARDWKVSEGFIVAYTHVLTYTHTHLCMKKDMREQTHKHNIYIYLNAHVPTHLRIYTQMHTYGHTPSHTHSHRYSSHRKAFVGVRCKVPDTDK